MSAVEPGAAIDATPPAPVAWLVERAAVTKDAQQATAGVTEPAALVARLFETGHLADALRVVASALPPREAVWWAWGAATHAVRLAGDGATKPEVPEALAATERWIASPDDQTRRAAWGASERAGLDTPAGCAAAAPFFIAGSIAPPEVSFIPPPPGIHTTLVATAVFLASAVDPAHLEALARAYAAQGLEIIKQLGGWPASMAAARAHHDAQRELQLKAIAPPVASAPTTPPPSR
jgi:hypothetical protein